MTGTATPQLRSTTEQRLEFGRDEINLAEFPLWVHGNISPKNKTLVFKSSVNDPRGAGRLIERQMTLRATEDLGLPCTRDALILFALLAIAWQNNQFATREVHFTFKEILDILGWDDSGANYNRIELALKRWDSIHIEYDGWYDKATNDWADGPMLCGITSGGKIQPKRKRHLPSFIRWHEDFYPTLQHKNIRVLNLQELTQLSSPTAMQAYRFLEKEFGRKQRGRPVTVIEKDLRQLACEHIGMSRSLKPTRLRQNLNAIFVELEKMGCVEKVPPETRYRRVDRSTWMVTIRKARQKPIADDAKQIDLFDRDPLLSELCGRGITPETARKLAKQYDEELILQQIAYCDWRVALGEIEHVPSYLPKAIEENFSPPKDYVTPEEQQRIQVATEKASADREAKRQRKQQQEIENQAQKAATYKREMQQIEAYLKTLPEAEQNLAIDAALSEHDKLRFGRKFWDGRDTGDTARFSYENALRLHILPQLQSSLCEPTQ